MRILLLAWIFFVPICSILPGWDIGTVSGQCLGDQRALLLQLQSNFTFSTDQSTKLVQWDSNSDCCSWLGVTCDKEGRVVGLNLSSESISGSVENSTLFNLGHLRSLDLSYNNFDSTIPASIGNLGNLTYLNLSNAGFGGQVPIELSRLTRLVTLDISVLQFYRVSNLKIENPNLRMVIGNLSELEQLYLDGVNISALGSDWCRALSSSVPNLRVMSLSDCYLSGPLDSSLEKLRSLSVIRLDSNNLSSIVPGFISSFSNLTSLRMSSCRLYGTFPQKIFLVSTLQNIDISFNQFLEGSLPEFPQDSALQRLVLGSTNFTGSLPSSIGSLRNLSRLDLSHCRFNGTLPSSMEQLSQLLDVDLSNNKFTGPVPSFKRSKNLTEISLNHNSLTGPITSAHWEGLDKLVVLDLGNNLLNGSIPASLFVLPSLEKIQLSNNQFDGQLSGFPVLSSSVLDTLDLSSNNLEGPIPMPIFHLPNLSILSFSSNNLNGTIQLDKISGLTNLTTLDLSYNKLTVNATGNLSSWSSLPKLRTLKLASCRLKRFPYLKNQATLSNLDLSDNQIHGEVPNWIWELGNGSLQYLNLSCNYLGTLQQPYKLPIFLSVLDLHSNQISAYIPTLPPVLSYLDFSNNFFSSSIPEVPIDSLSNLYVYSLSNNTLTGRIPESLCDASYLQVLDLSQNRLSGNIPECISKLSQPLGVLNLRRNNFSGQIPDVFPVNCGLQTLDLNGNSFEGQIPKSLANCSRLEILDLGNNNLRDKFPCMLKNISSLQVLVLRSNKFHDQISCPETNGTWEKLQIVDLSHNNFSGALPGRCMKKWNAMTTAEEDGVQSKLNHLKFEFLEYNPSLYYRDTVTVTFKGLEMELQKILTVFTSIDLSCNNFVGQIPPELVQLQALYILNLSHNALTGQIPSSIGNLQQLESLDLSSNFLSGEIPASLASIDFLSFLNLSFNLLVGPIPSGRQFQTFSPDSFAGNEELCGFPLPASCSNNLTSSHDAEPSFWSEIEFDWDSISGGIGFGVGAGAVVALLMVWREGKYWFEDSIDDALMVILPRLGYSYRPRDEWDDDVGSYLAEDHEDTETETETEDHDFLGQFCVFCSKLDISKKRAIHDLRCTCHSSPPMSSSSFYSSSSSSLQ